ncbi:MAG: hypothetical protein ACLFRP_08745 [Puniceicoccaceae bacterium]
MKHVPLRFLVLFGLLVLGGLLGFQWFRASETRGYPEPFPVEGFLREPLQFAGNRYHLNATVTSLLSSEDRLGRILLVSPESGGEPLPLFVPASLERNVKFQQRYRFKLSVEDGGLLYVNELDKI